MNEAHIHLEALLANETVIAQIEEAGNYLAKSLQGRGGFFYAEMAAEYHERRAAPPPHCSLPKVPQRPAAIHAAS